MSEDNKRLRITVNFRDKDKELYDWVLTKGDLIGVSSAIKVMLAEIKAVEESKK